MDKKWRQAAVDVYFLINSLFPYRDSDMNALLAGALISLVDDD